MHCGDNVRRRYAVLLRDTIQRSTSNQRTLSVALANTLSSLEVGTFHFRQAAAQSVVLREKRACRLFICLRPQEKQRAS